jgi:hypothetical protein
MRLSTQILATIAIALAAAAAPSDASAQAAVPLLNYTATVPVGWVTAATTSPMRLAQYTIPGRGGAVGAEVVVYFFGSGQGGDVAANLARWKSQFSNPRGTPVYENVVHEKNTPFPITIAEYRGTYARGIGAGNAEGAKPGQSLIAAIAETPEGTLFFQLFGATANVTAQRATLIRFVRSMSVKH